MLNRRTGFAYFLISGNFKIHSIETLEQSRKKELERRMKDEKKGFSSVPWLCCVVITAKVWRTVRCSQVYLREALLNTWGSKKAWRNMNFKITLWADCRCGSTYPCWIRIWWFEKGYWGPSFSVVKQRTERVGIGSVKVSSEQMWAGCQTAASFSL